MGPGPAALAFAPRPLAPSASLPLLRRLDDHTYRDVFRALDNLRALYCPLPLLPAFKIHRRVGHLISEATTPVIDSGYASAVEEEDEEDPTCDADVLRADPLERAFAIKWLTGFLARAECWTPAREATQDNEDNDDDDDEDDDEEEDLDARRAALIDTASAVLAAFTDPSPDTPEPADLAVSRAFAFAGPAGAVRVALNDAPLRDDDHTAVGLQSWGSAVLLAARLCAAPARFGLVPGARVLELGAGTGLLSLVAARVLRPDGTGAPVQPPVVATDYHPAVLANLRANVAANFPGAALDSGDAPVLTARLDWSAPAYGAPLDAPFDAVLAADVVYAPEHARWLKGCVAATLAPRGTFWLIVPLRSTGRHEGIADTVQAVFPAAEAVHARDGEKALVVRGMEELGKERGIGRADEGGYRLFEIGWA